MKIIESLNNITTDENDQLLVIGNFDGVHKGHKHLLDQAKEIAHARNLKIGLLTFEPHPRHLFRPNDPPFRLTPRAIKNRILEQYGIDFTCILDFNWDFASQSPLSFIDSVLKDGLKPAHIVVGDDFHFGQLRKGNAQTLQQAGYTVTIVDEYCTENEERISSTRIRNALRHGQIDTANDLLGWKWEIQGTVQKGDQRGREIGYPTANVHLQDTLHPAYGIYATFVQIIEDGEDAPWLPAATNIGIRPMFEVAIGQVEAHILDFDRDIYHKTLRIRPVQKLRGEAKFDSLDELISQIEKDCQTAMNVLKNSQ